MVIPPIRRSLVLGAMMLALAVESAALASETRSADDETADPGTAPTARLQQASALVGGDVVGADGERGGLEAVILDLDQDMLAAIGVDLDEIGDRRHALPWHVVDHLERSPTDPVATLAVSADRIRREAPAFPQTRWPSTHDPAWKARVLHAFEGLRAEDPHRTLLGGRSRARDAAGGLRHADHVWLDGLLGLPVRDHADRRLGTLEDVVLDLTEGRLVYGVVGLDGPLGLEEDLVVVPWSAFGGGYQHDELILDATRDELRAIAYEEGHFPPAATLPRARSLHERLDRRPYWVVHGYRTLVEADARHQNQVWGPDGPQARRFAAGDPVTVSGEIASVGSVVLAPAATPGVRVRVETSDGPRTVHAGPREHLRREGVTLTAGTHVEVAGRTAEFDGRTVVIARELDLGDRAIAIRDPDGTARWSPDELVGRFVATDAGTRSDHEQAPDAGKDDAS